MIDKNGALKSALESISGKARKARMKEELPESEHPAGFMISIGIRPISDEDKELLEEATDEIEEEEEDEEEEEV